MEKLIDKLSTYNINPNSYIVPGGYLGQFIYYYCKPKMINGFLDNDDAKQGRRVYGTPNYVYSFDKLLEHLNDDALHIYIFGGPYTAEILEQVLTYSEKFHVHVIDYSQLGVASN